MWSDPSRRGSLTVVEADEVAEVLVCSLLLDAVEVAVADADQILILHHQRVLVRVQPLYDVPVVLHMQTVQRYPEHETNLMRCRRQRTRYQVRRRVTIHVRWIHANKPASDIRFQPLFYVHLAVLLLSHLQRIGHRVPIDGVVQLGERIAQVP